MATPLPSPVPNGFVRLYDRRTPEGKREFLLDKQVRLPETRNAQWDRPALTGAPSAEGDEFLASFAQNDLSAGFGIKDADESVNMQNYWFGKVDARRPHQICA